MRTVFIKEWRQLQPGVWIVAVMAAAAWIARAGSVRAFVAPRESWQVGQWLFALVLGAAIGFHQLASERAGGMRGYLWHRGVGIPAILAAKVAAGWAAILFATVLPVLAAAVLASWAGEFASVLQIRRVLEFAAIPVAGLSGHAFGALATTLPVGRNQQPAALLVGIVGLAAATGTPMLLEWGEPGLRTAAFVLFHVVLGAGLVVLLHRRLLHGEDRHAVLSGGVRSWSAAACLVCFGGAVWLTLGAGALAAHWDLLQRYPRVVWDGAETFGALARDERALRFVDQGRAPLDTTDLRRRGWSSGTDQFVAVEPGSSDPQTVWGDAWYPFDDLAASLAGDEGSGPPVTWHVGSLWRELMVGGSGLRGETTYAWGGVAYLEPATGSTHLLVVAAPSEVVPCGPTCGTLMTPDSACVLPGKFPRIVHAQRPGPAASPDPGESGNVGPWGSWGRYGGVATIFDPRDRTFWMLDPLELGEVLAPAPLPDGDRFLRFEELLCPTPAQVGIAQPYSGERMVVGERGRYVREERSWLDHGDSNQFRDLVPAGQLDEVRLFDAEISGRGGPVPAIAFRSRHDGGLVYAFAFQPHGRAEQALLIATRVLRALRAPAVALVSFLEAPGESSLLRQLLTEPELRGRRRPDLLALNLLVAAVLAALAHRKLQRDGRSRATRIVWSLVVLATGPAGFLTMLVVEPARGAIRSSSRAARQLAPLLQTP